MNHSLQYDHYYRYQEIADLLRSYAKAHPELARLTPIGLTPQGREILAIEITNTATGAWEEKPAYYMEANIHAGEVCGSMVAIYLLDTIFSNLEDLQIKQMLERYTLYIVPRLSCDGSEHYLTTPDWVRSAPRPWPYEQDMPGLRRQDLDGDGVARMMRVPSPYGVWKVSEKDPRLMEKRRPDETDGQFYNVYPEGIIEEYDGLHIPMAPAKFGADFNRNYPVGWQDDSLQAGAGAYPLCHPETRANADFLLSHPNVCCVLDMHTAGGQILHTPGYKHPKEADQADMDIYRALGQMGHEETGFPVLNLYTQYMPASNPATYGGFDDFCHFLLGVPGFTVECWDLSERAGFPLQYPPAEHLTDEQQLDCAYKHLQWLDENLGKDAFQPWTPFEHPQLGRVEIGGADFKFTQQNPPIKFLEQEVEKISRFALRLIRTLPHVVFDKAEARSLGGGLYQVEVVVGNRGYLPTYVFKEGLKLKTLKELTLSLEGAGAVEGKLCQKIGHLQGLSGLNARNSGMGPNTIETEPLQKKVSWVVKANPGDVLRLTCQGGRIGAVRTEITLA